MKRWSDAEIAGIVHLVILACLLLSGMVRGFTFPVVLGILGLLLVHYRFDFKFMRDRDVKLPGLQGFAGADDLEKLQEKVNQLSTVVALKLGTMKRPAGIGGGT